MVRALNDGYFIDNETLPSLWPIKFGRSTIAAWGPESAASADGIPDHPCRLSCERERRLLAFRPPPCRANHRVGLPAGQTECVGGPRPPNKNGDRTVPSYCFSYTSTFLKVSPRTLLAMTVFTRVLPSTAMTPRLVAATWPSMRSTYLKVKSSMRWYWVVLDPGAPRIGDSLPSNRQIISECPAWPWSSTQSVVTRYPSVAGSILDIHDR